VKLLVTGFGPFTSRAGPIDDNPAARLARALDGRQEADLHIIGREIPVSYERGITQTLDLARLHAVDAVLGIGVAVSRGAAALETRGVARTNALPDVDGVFGPDLEGPPVCASTLDVGRWAEALGVDTSDDAGSYVCNAWLHQVVQALDVPVGFLHVTRDGLDPDRVTSGLVRLTAAGLS
jgi:pyrrolidone-carboxylate peptidase